jgi:hypothetical protein
MGWPPILQPPMPPPTVGNKLHSLEPCFRCNAFVFSIGLPLISVPKVPVGFLGNSRGCSECNDPRRQTASIDIYTHVRDRWGISYAQPILLNERQAGAAIEGVIRDERHETSLLAVDTHGYTGRRHGDRQALGF